MWRRESIRSGSTINKNQGNPLPEQEKKTLFSFEDGEDQEEEIHCDFFPPALDYVNRRVDFRFAGQNICLDLCLKLFSSAGVDKGSQLLLKTLAQKSSLDSLEMILDVGCGVGSLGLALAKRCPHALVELVDRDALALAFTQKNAALNTLSNTRIHSRLLLEGASSDGYDLILSNFPAKAGDPVLNSYIIDSLKALKARAVACIVIVNTLAESCREFILKNAAVIILEEKSAQHTVFHYQREDHQESSPIAKGERALVREEATLLDPYIRRKGMFTLKNRQYSLETAWNISDFDTLSWRLTLLGKILNKVTPWERTLFWAPGQGHLSAAFYLNRKAKPQQIVLAGPDRLELLLSAKNMRLLVPRISIRIVTVAAPELLDKVFAPESFDFLVSDLHPVPRTNGLTLLPHALGKILKEKGQWALVGRSHDIALLEKKLHNFTVVTDKRKQGQRALVCQKIS